MRSADMKTDMLHRVPLFADLNRKQLREVARIADEMRFDAGRVLMREGELGRELFIILEGRANATRDGHHLGEVGPGDAVGEMALIDHGPRTATVVATEPMDVLIVSGRAFDRLKEVVPGLTDALLKTAVRRLREADAIIAG